MNKKIVSVLFIIIISALVVFFVVTRYKNTGEDTSTEAILKTPKLSDYYAQSAVESSAAADEESLVSLIELKSDETLVGVVSQDFTGDGYEDQINAVKTSQSPYISLIIGIYNPKTALYERSGVISTQISQTKTFSFTGMDLTGDHRTALVYQGFKDNGDSVMQAYFISTRRDRIALNKIVDLTGDGSVYIQQSERAEAYERSNANGSSYSIWVYGSDPSNPNSTDQLQSKYEWNSSSGKYELTDVIRIAGSKIAAAELSKIQDGTTATFTDYLNGLWYKIDNSGKVQYLFFDKDSSEIIFLQDDAEEVYTWVNSTIRRNGIYLSATNLDIEDLQRRIDISLRTLDEINMRIQDDVRMPISENNTWDGEYKKSNSAMFANFNGKHLELNNEEIIALLEKYSQWKVNDGTIAKFTAGRYTLQGDDVNASGIYTSLVVNSTPFIQFRRESGTLLLNGVYMSQHTKDAESAEKNTIVLQEYKITPSGIQPAESKPVILTAVE